MTDNIWGQRFYGHRTPGWHLLGTVSQEELGAREAVELIGADYKVATIPQFIDIDGTQLATGQFAIVREPTVDEPVHEIFGFATQDYEIIQNEQVADLVEPLTDLWPVETVGALDKGKTFFMTLDAGEKTLNSKDGRKGSERVHNYFLVSDRKDGGTSFKIAFTPVRVVCQNTLSIGLKQATVSASIAHKTGVTGQIHYRAQLLKKLQEAQNVTWNAFEALAQAIVDTDALEEIFAVAYPHPTTPSKVHLLKEIAGHDVTAEFNELVEKLGLQTAEKKWLYEVALADRRREAARQCLVEMNDSNPHMANSLWYGWQAVCEVEDYRRGNNRAEDAVDEASLASALFGQRASIKKKAFNAAYNMA